MYRFVSKLLAVALLLFSCSDIDRDNLLDPKNEDSFSEAPVLIEAFINSELSYNEEALGALDQIENIYGDEVLLIEYHREIVVNDSLIKDDYSNPIFTSLHENYANTYLDYPKAIPDIYLDGSEGRILGASSSAAVVDRIEELLPDLLNKQSNYHLEIDLEVSGDNLNIDYRVARLGNRSANSLNLQVVLIKNSGTSQRRGIVLYINYPVAEVVPSITAGEYSEGQLSIDLGQVEIQPDEVIFKLVQENSIEVLHTFKKEIEW